MWCYAGNTLCSGIFVYWFFFFFFLQNWFENVYLYQSKPFLELLNKYFSLVKECRWALYQPFHTAVSLCTADTSTSTDSFSLCNIHSSVSQSMFKQHCGMKTGIITKIIDQFLAQWVAVPKIHPLWHHLASSFLSTMSSGHCLLLMPVTQRHASFNKVNFG